MLELYFDLVKYLSEVHWVLYFKRTVFTIFISLYLFILHLRHVTRPPEFVRTDRQYKGHHELKDPQFWEKKKLKNKLPVYVGFKNTLLRVYTKQLYGALKASFLAFLFTFTLIGFFYRSVFFGKFYSAVLTAFSVYKGPLLAQEVSDEYERMQRVDRTLLTEDFGGSWTFLGDTAFIKRWEAAEEAVQEWPHIISKSAFDLVGVEFVITLFLSLFCCFVVFVIYMLILMQPALDALSLKNLYGICNCVFACLFLVSVLVFPGIMEVITTMLGVSGHLVGSKGELLAVSGLEIINVSKFIVYSLIYCNILVIFWFLFLYLISRGAIIISNKDLRFMVFIVTFAFSVCFLPLDAYIHCFFYVFSLFTVESYILLSNMFKLLIYKINKNKYSVPNKTFTLVKKN